MAAARQVRDQDVDLAGPAPALRRGVAKDRRISVEDAQMRHGRKSRSVLFDGYKRHVLRDLDTGLVPAVGHHPGQRARGQRHRRHRGRPAGRRDGSLAELHIDRAYLSSALVRDRGPDLAIFCKAWRVRNTGGRFAKDQFTLDFAAGQLTCPAGVAMPFEPGKTVRFPRDTCAACPLRATVHRQQHRAQRVHPSRRGAARRAAPAPADPGRARGSCVNASRSSTRLPTSGTGRAAAPATWAPARTYSTCAASPSSTTSTSSPASLTPTSYQLAA